MKNIFCAAALALLLMTITFLAFNIQPVKGVTITVPDDYPTIQAAVNAAFENDTVFVRNGTYYENVVVNKTVALVGEDAMSTVIDGGGSGYVVRVSANGVNVSGFTIRNSGYYPNGAGIKLENTSHCCMAGNNITANLFFAGVWFSFSFNNTVSGNNITNNGNGVYIDSSFNNTVSGNNITNDGNNGVFLIDSFNNTVSENNITNNNSGVSLERSDSNTVSGNNITNSSSGVYLGHSSNNTVSENIFVNDGLVVYGSYGNVVVDNLVNSKPLVYLEGVSDVAVVDAGQVVLVNCNRIRVENLNLSCTDTGIQLWQTNNTGISGNNITNDGSGIYLYPSSNNNTVSGNNIANNLSGIYLGGSSNNTISGNNITATGNYGIRLEYSSNYNIFRGNNITNRVELFSDSSKNRFFHNNFMDNAQQVHIDPSGSSNIWDDGYPSGGNYWSNYTDVDLHSGPYQNETGGDGIWDHPYVIDASNQDNYPIVPEFPSATVLPLFMAISLLGLVLAKKRNPPIR